MMLHLEKVRKMSLHFFVSFFSFSTAGFIQSLEFLKTINLPREIKFGKMVKSLELYNNCFMV